MLASVSTRLRIATDSRPALASLRLESAPYCSQQPSSHPFSFATVLPTRSATPHFGYPSARPAVSTLRRRHSIPIHPPR